MSTGRLAVIAASDEMFQGRALGHEGLFQLSLQCHRQPEVVLRGRDRVPQTEPLGGGEELAQGPPGKVIIADLEGAESQVSVRVGGVALVPGEGEG